MVDKIIDYDEEDILWMKGNPERTFLNKIQQSLHLTRVILYCGKKIIGDGSAFITVPEIAEKFHSNTGHTHQLLNDLVFSGILKKQKPQGERRVRYFLKDKEKLERGIKVAKTNLQNEEIKKQVES